jgi:hypothetical protein
VLILINLTNKHSLSMYRSGDGMAGYRVCGFSLGPGLGFIVLSLQLEGVLPEWDDA